MIDIESSMEYVESGPDLEESSDSSEYEDPWG